MNESFRLWRSVREEGAELAVLRQRKGVSVVVANRQVRQVDALESGASFAGNVFEEVGGEFWFVVWGSKRVLRPLSFMS